MRKLKDRIHCCRKLNQCVVQQVATRLNKKSEIYCDQLDYHAAVEAAAGEPTRQRRHAPHIWARIW
jgi:hypothetical protein